MDARLQTLLDGYDLSSETKAWQALREVVQQIALLGLWRGKFFEHAAFCGGTSLRILHGLPRFSEDMDFSLLKPVPGFSLDKYSSYLLTELKSFGFDVELKYRTKTVPSAFESAFVKMNTRLGWLSIGVPESIRNRVARDRALKVKIEVDTDPPEGAATESHFLYRPQAHSIRAYDLPSMFAGKLHAILARAWKTRVKGRDWYDLLWFIGKGVQASSPHLRKRLIQSGHLDAKAAWNTPTAKRMLQDRVGAVDFRAAVRDVSPFLEDTQQLELWGPELFSDAVNRVEFRD